MRASPQVIFTSDFFKPVAGEEEETNPGCFGKALAQWLAERLEASGIHIAGIVPEDFGWVVMVSRKPYILWLGCGSIDGSTTQWRVFPSAELSALQRLFKRVDPNPEIEKLRVLLAELVPSIPGVSNVIWE